jgi:hypothetical protein
MLTIALFISGRLTCYEEYLLPLLEYLNKKYKINLFCSINSDYNEKYVNDLKKYLVNINFERFMYSEEWISNRILHKKTFLGPFNQLSMFYNDLKCFKMIEKYQHDNNMEFDIICKIRPDMKFNDFSNIIFIKDDKNLLIINSCVPQYQIYMFGHKDTPLMICDAFAYGNFESMQIYCNTYNWIIEQDKILLGTYDRTFEPYLNESILCCCFDTYKEQINTTEKIIDKFLNNPRNIKIRYFNAPYLHSDKRKIFDNINIPKQMTFENTTWQWCNSRGGLVLI